MRNIWQIQIDQRVYCPKLIKKFEHTGRRTRGTYKSYGSGGGHIEQNKDAHSCYTHLKYKGIIFFIVLRKFQMVHLECRSILVERQHLDKAL